MRKIAASYRNAIGMLLERDAAMHKPWARTRMGSYCNPFNNHPKANTEGMFVDVSSSRMSFVGRWHI